LINDVGVAEMSVIELLSHSVGIGGREIVVLSVSESEETYVAEPVFDEVFAVNDDSDDESVIEGRPLGGLVGRRSSDLVIIGSLEVLDVNGVLEVSFVVVAIGVVELI
jgi:hypothetical protein